MLTSFHTITVLGLVLAPSLLSSCLLRGECTQYKHDMVYRQINQTFRVSVYYSNIKPTVTVCDI